MGEKPKSSYRRQYALRIVMTAAENAICNKLLSMGMPVDEVARQMLNARRTAQGAGLK